MNCYFSVESDNKLKTIKNIIYYIYLYIFSDNESVLKP